MSIQKHRIEIAPVSYKRNQEQMIFENYECPVCHGNGGYREETRHDNYKWNECDYCEGAGKIKAEVTIKWRPNL